ncbi:MAG: hypothetical protein WBF02_04180, partial [Xanthobacteraceae bacterium]
MLLVRGYRDAGSPGKKMLAADSFFTTNPFALLSAAISPAIMQAYVIVMIVLVVGGTLFDVVHKRSATYFFANWRDSRSNARQQVGGGKMVSLA